MAFSSKSDFIAQLVEFPSWQGSKLWPSLHGVRVEQCLLVECLRNWPVAVNLVLVMATMSNGITGLEARLRSSSPKLRASSPSTLSRDPLTTSTTRRSTYSSFGSSTMATLANIPKFDVQERASRRLMRGASETPVVLEDRRPISRFLRSGSVLNNGVEFESSSRRLSSNIRDFMVRTDKMFDHTTNLLNDKYMTTSSTTPTTRTERAQSLMPTPQSMATSRSSSSTATSSTLRRSLRASSLSSETAGTTRKSRFSVEERIRNLDDECNAILSNSNANDGLKRRQRVYNGDSDNTLDDISIDELDETSLGSRTLNASSSTLISHRRCSDPDCRRRLREASKHLDVLKKRLEQQHEEGTEHLVLFKRQFEKKVRELTERLESTRQSALHFERETQRLQCENANSKKALEQSESSVVDFENRLRRARSDLEMANEAKEKNDVAAKKLKKELKDVKINNKRLKTDLEALQKNRRHVDDDKLDKEAKEEDDENENFDGNEEKESKRLRSRLEELETKMREERLEKDSLESKLRKLESSKLELEQKLELLVKRHTSDMRSKEETMEAMREATERRVEALEHQLEEEHQERVRVSKERREMQRRIVNMSNENDADDNISNLRAMLVDAVVEGDRHQQHFTVVQHLKNMVKSKSRSSFETINLEESEQGRVSALRSKQRMELELISLQHSLDKSLENNDQLRSQVKRTQHQKQEMEKLLEDKEQALKSTLERLDKTLREVDKLNETIEEKNNDMDTAHQENNQLKSQVEALESRMTRVSESSASLVQKLKLQLDHCDSNKLALDQRLQRLKASNDELVDECEHLRDRREELETLLHKFREELHVLKDENVMLVQRDQESNAALSKLEQEVQLAEIESSVARNEANAATRRARALAMARNRASGSDASLDSLLVDCSVSNVHQNLARRSEL